MSPTFRRYKGYSFKIYSNEEERMHIHVIKEDHEATALFPLDTLPAARALRLRRRTRPAGERPAADRDDGVPGLRLCPHRRGGAGDRDLDRPARGGAAQL